MKLIKTAFTLFFLLCAAAASAATARGVHEDHPYEFEITRDPYLLATYFQIHSHDTYIGTVNKSSLRIRTNYDLSDEYGWQATGIKRVLTLGLFYAWGSEIDIYDTQGNKIGMIDGQVGTTENAKFSLYDYDEEGNYNCIGIAYLDRDYDSFTILYPNGGPHPIAKLERIDSSTIDFWKVRVYHPHRIDDRMVRIFAAFVVDYQDYFRQPQPPQDKYEDEYQDDVY